MEPLTWAFIGTILGTIVGASSSIITTVITAKNSSKIQRELDKYTREENFREFQRNNYLKLQDQINSPMFGISKDFTIERSGFDSSSSSIDITKGLSLDLLKHSKAISSSILSLLTETDLNRYNALTITKSFLGFKLALTLHVILLTWFFLRFTHP